MQNNEEPVNSWTVQPGKKEDIDFDLFGNTYKDEFRKIYESNETYKGKWNWRAFLFGWLWCLVKGCWAYAIIIILSIIITYGSTIGWFIALVWAILLGLRGTWLAYNVKVKQKQFPKSLF